MTDHLNGGSALQSFTNLPVAPSELPELAATTFQPVQVAWRNMRLATWAVLALPAIASVVALSFADVPLWLSLAPAAGLLAVAAIGATFEVRAYPYRGWLLRTHDISSRQGLISRRTTTAPFSRVQHVTVSQGGLSRMFGVAQLNVFTAGAGLADLTVQGLAPDAAERLKAQIIEQAQG